MRLSRILLAVILIAPLALISCGGTTEQTEKPEAGTGKAPAKKLQVDSRSFEATRGDAEKAVEEGAEAVEGASEEGAEAVEGAVEEGAEALKDATGGEG